MLSSALYLSCPAGTASPSTPPFLLPYTCTHEAAHTHIDVCMCRAGATVLCLHYALVRWSHPRTSMHHSCGFPFLELGPPNMHSLVPGSRLVMSWAHSKLCWTNAAHVLLQQTPAYLKELIHTPDIYRCPYGPPIYSHRVKNTTSRFQCTFHQLTGLVTLSPELLNLRLNALREHRGWLTTL